MTEGGEVKFGPKKCDIFFEWPLSISAQYKSFIYLLTYNDNVQSTLVCNLTLIIRTFILVEFWVKVVQSGDDEVIDKTDLITQILHLNRQLLLLLACH